VLPNPGFVHRSVRYNTSGFSFFFPPILWHRKNGKKISKKLAKLVKFTLEKHITKTFPIFCQQNLSQKNSLVQIISHGGPWRKEGYMFNYKTDHQFHLQSFSGFLLTFFSTQRGKMGGEKFKQKRIWILCFLSFKFVS
jgi:hypothetical protein